MDKDFIEQLIRDYPIYDISITKSDGDININIRRPRPEEQVSTWLYGKKVRIGDEVELLSMIREYPKGEKFYVLRIPENNVFLLIHKSGKEIMINKGACEKIKDVETEPREFKDILNDMSDYALPYCLNRFEVLKNEALRYLDKVSKRD